MMEWALKNQYKENYENAPRPIMLNNKYSFILDMDRVEDAFGGKW